jgi:transcriptional regulator with GAF, ATPase, and Fis domain
VSATPTRLIGSRMITFLRFDRERFDMERIYCTQPERYPMGVRKAMRRGPWLERVADRGVPFIASGEAQMRAEFPDHAALAAMGVLSTMCVPVRHAGATLGTMNLNGEEGRYGEREAALAQPFAALAAPLFLTYQSRT